MASNQTEKSNEMARRASRGRAWDTTNHYPSFGPGRPRKLRAGDFLRQRIINVHDFVDHKIVNSLVALATCTAYQKSLNVPLCFGN
jgi:hypothetical protein